MRVHNLLRLANKLATLDKAQASFETPPQDIPDNLEAIEELENEWLENEPDDGYAEDAAEGIHLQFCNFVVNYGMHWNPEIT